MARPIQTATSLQLSSNGKIFLPPMPKIQPPPTVRLVGGGQITLGGGVGICLDTFGLCAGRLICTTVAGVTTCIETVAGTAIGILTAEVSACILVGIGVAAGAVVYVCKNWLDQYGEAFEEAKRLALIEEAFCNTQWGPTSELAKIAAAMFEAGTISQAFYQETMDKLARLLKTCVDKAWATVMKFVNDAVKWVDDHMAMAEGR